MRAANFLGLFVVFTCLLLSAGYIKRELSYDRHHTNANRIVRLSLQSNNEPVDGRIWGNTLDGILQQLSEVDQIVKMRNIPSAVLSYQGEQRIVNDFYQVNRNFLQVFDIQLLQGDKNDAPQRRDQVLISESFARQLFGTLDNNEPLMSEISLEGRRLVVKRFLFQGYLKTFPKPLTSIPIYCCIFPMIWNSLFIHICY
ncbi:MAG: ABC transporter permease [Prevotellaceae bacterium]|nr:ABC transporter permease [Prevotellaceae bacterium]